MQGIIFALVRLYLVCYFYKFLVNDTQGFEYYCDFHSKVLTY